MKNKIEQAIAKVIKKVLGFDVMAKEWGKAEKRHLSSWVITLLLFGLALFIIDGSNHPVPQSSGGFNVITITDVEKLNLNGTDYIRYNATSGAVTQEKIVALINITGLPENINWSEVNISEGGLQILFQAYNLTGVEIWCGFAKYNETYDIMAVCTWNNANRSLEYVGKEIISKSPYTFIIKSDWIGVEKRDNLTVATDTDNPECVAIIGLPEDVNWTQEYIPYTKTGCISHLTFSDLKDGQEYECAFSEYNETLERRAFCIWNATTRNLEYFRTSVVEKRQLIEPLLMEDNA